MAPPARKSPSTLLVGSGLFFSSLIFSALFFALGCAPTAEDALSAVQGKGTKGGKASASGSKGQTKGQNPSQPTPPATSFVTLTDPVEKAYTVSLPKGWANRTYSARVFDWHTIVDITISPNGSVLIFSGDPNMPNHTKPEYAGEAHYQMARLVPIMKIDEFQTADAYFGPYVKQKFGKLPDFKMVSIQPDHEMEAKIAREFQKAGMQANPTTARVKFTYSDRGVKRNALIIGSSIENQFGWLTFVSGVTSTGAPEQYLPMMETIGRSRKMNPQWQQEQNSKHQSRMAQIEEFGRQMTAQHNANMAAIQASAQRHQQRMQAIWDAGDASMRNYYNRMNSMDLQHERFLNYINDENTVVSSSGKSFQVDNSYQRYYMNKATNKYIGGDAHMSIDDLRKLGLNPDDYEEVKIRK